MRRICMSLCLIYLLTMPVCGMDFQAPQAPDRVSEIVSETADSLGEGLWNLIRWAISETNGSVREAMTGCLAAACCVILSTVLCEVTSGSSQRAIRFGTCVAVAGILLEPSQSLIRLGIETAEELSEYGKLLIPVMTGTLAARGGVSSSAALYAATTVFNSFLSAFLSKLTIPVLYLFLVLSISCAAMNIPLLEKMRDFLQWCMTWIMKIVLYLFTGYITVTGVISGSADASAVRAARIAISGAVPVIGGMLSDASEAVMISAGTLGSAAGVYGMVTVLALFSGPFVRIGVQYLLLKATGAFCLSIDSNAGLITDFAGAMGILLGMVSTQTVLLMISTLCFMKGVA